MRQLRFALAVAVSGLGLVLSGRAAALKLEAANLFEQAVTEHLCLSEHEAAVELDNGELFEDDGPAAGHSYQVPENVEQVGGNTWLRKELIIPNPQARAAFLVVLSGEPFEAVINGQPQTLAENLSGRSGYRTYSFDPRILKRGRNQIVIHGSGRVMLAREDEFASGSRTRAHHPNRSAKSIDGGRTWDYEHLGPGGKLDGEYGVRVYLDHHQPEGVMTLPVIDSANLDGNPISPPLTEASPITLKIDGNRGHGGGIFVRARTGTTLVPGEQTWSDWNLLGERGGTIQQPRGRFVQLELRFTTTDPLASPRIRSVEVVANPARRGDWTKELLIEEHHNETIVRTSIPFEYEPLDHPDLRQLRQEYKLDEVVAGATNELDLLLRLAQWSCNAWDWPNHIGDLYPSWNALDILKQEPDGTPVGGFCQQFNVVFLQACESFGFSGRAISISQGRMQEQHPGGGHEIVEIWSNEWKKWVYVDGALAWYVVDEKTGIPLSMLELRERQLQVMNGQPSPAVRVVVAERTRNKQFDWKG
ncbi:MAG TPA: hypothetical protein VHI52_15235, partial [Verrucomicrobiae bacterium]|nr:hypothetical protein [Verrucomicrobiae bacterium]